MGGGQEWGFVRQDDGSYALVNGVSGLCVDVGVDVDGASSGPGAGARVIQRDCSGRDSQHWYVTPQSGGGYLFTSVSSGLQLTGSLGVMGMWGFRMLLGDFLGRSGVLGESQKLKVKSWVKQALPAGASDPSGNWRRLHRGSGQSLRWRFVRWGFVPLGPVGSPTGTAPPPGCQVHAVAFEVLPCCCRCMDWTPGRRHCRQSPADVTEGNEPKTQAGV
ncbi:RICIN domain-containing protein [Catenulispora yoronensis]